MIIFLETFKFLKLYPIQITKSKTNPEDKNRMTLLPITYIYLSLDKNFLKLDNTYVRKGRNEENEMKLVFFPFIDVIPNICPLNMRC